MLVEAAWVICDVPGPLRAFFMRIRDKRGKHVAEVATARKLAVIVWHLLSRDEDYANRTVTAAQLPDDPDVLKAMVLARDVENARLILY